MIDYPFKEGARTALPIVFGYLPVGMAFGVLARKAGLSTFEAGGMSLLVYAGASQFIAVEMISRGALWLPIVLTTFFLNLRHLLMSSSLSLYFNESRFRILGLLSAQLTDESFAVAMSDSSKIVNRPTYLLGLQMTAQLAWIGGTVGGTLFGGMIDHQSYGIPFALPSLFICLLLLQIRKAHHLYLTAIAGILSIFFKWVFPGSWYIILTALFASGIGMLIHPKTSQEGEGKEQKSET